MMASLPCSPADVPGGLCGILPQHGYRPSWQRP